MPTRLISDERMFILMEWALKKELAADESSFLEKIDFGRTNIRNIRVGNQSFQIRHLINACKLTGASANWLLGLDNQMFRKPGRTALELLQEAVISVEQELSKKSKK